MLSPISAKLGKKSYDLWVSPDSPSMVYASESMNGFGIFGDVAEFTAMVEAMKAFPIAMLHGSDRANLHVRILSSKPKVVVTESATKVKKSDTTTDTTATNTATTTPDTTIYLPDGVTINSDTVKVLDKICEQLLTDSDYAFINRMSLSDNALTGMLRFHVENDPDFVAGMDRNDPSYMDTIAAETKTSFATFQRDRSALFSSGKSKYLPPSKIATSATVDITVSK